MGRDANIILSGRTLFAGLFVVIVVSDSIIFVAQINSEDFFASYIVTINGSIAAGFAMFLLCKQQFHGIHHKTHVALVSGLVLLLSAEVVLGTYQLLAPSAADYLWLCAYGFLGYYLFMTYKELQRKIKFGRQSLVVSIIGNVIFLCCIIGLTAKSFELSNSRGFELFLFIVAYPILDSTLMIPAIVILIQFRKQHSVWLTPWICESLGVFLVVISDSWFAFPLVSNYLGEQLWISELFFAAHFLVVAAGLLWYIKLLIPSSSIPKNRTDFLTKPWSTPMIQMSPKKRTQTIAMVIGAAILFVILINPSSPLNAMFTNTSPEVIGPTNNYGKQIVTLGALLPLTGADSDTGESERAAVKIAFNNISESFSKNNSHVRIALIIEDTRSDAKISLEKLQDLRQKGVKLVIGTATSEELRGLQQYADKNGILLISPSSTAPSLAGGGRNTFRFVPKDTVQAQAISLHMWQDGVRVIVPMWRDDTYGHELVDAVNKSFMHLGGKVSGGVPYMPHTDDFCTSLNRMNFIIWSQDLKSLSSKVSQAVTQYGANKVGVYLVAFDEVAPIFNDAQIEPELSNVRWYGSDASVLNNNLVKNQESTSFAVKTGFVSPIYAGDQSYKFRSVDNQIRQEIGREPRPYAEVAYDAFRVAALTELKFSAIPAGTQDITHLKKTFLQIANSYKGITGDTSLNKAGDRKPGDYDFWAINPSNDNWTRVDEFHANANMRGGGLITPASN